MSPLLRALDQLGRKLRYRRVLRIAGLTRCDFCRVEIPRRQRFCSRKCGNRRDHRRGNLAVAQLSLARAGMNSIRFRVKAVSAARPRDHATARPKSRSAVR